MTHQREYTNSKIGHLSLRARRDRMRKAAYIAELVSKYGLYRGLRIYQGEKPNPRKNDD